jgi:hypothetical protein
MDKFGYAGILAHAWAVPLNCSPITVSKTSFKCNYIKCINSVHSYVNGAANMRIRIGITKDPEGLV